VKDYVPYKVLEYYDPVTFKEGLGVVSQGRLRCSCSSDDFAIQYIGKIRKGIIGNTYLCEEDNAICLSLTCSSCKKSLVLFDNNIDGYDALTVDILSLTTNAYQKLLSFSCPKCGKESFQVSVEYEHLPKEETDQVGIDDYRNAFQWIRVSLVCNSCRRKFRNFVDLETG